MCDAFLMDARSLRECVRGHSLEPRGLNRRNACAYIVFFLFLRNQNQSLMHTFWNMSCCVQSGAAMWSNLKQWDSPLLVVLLPQCFPDRKSTEFPSTCKWEESLLLDSAAPTGGRTLTTTLMRSDFASLCASVAATISLTKNNSLIKYKNREKLSM
jgi:hypothetical protein